MAPSPIHILCFLSVSILYIKSDTESVGYQLVTNERGVNEMLDFLAPDIDDLIIGTTIPAMDTSEVTTSSSEIESFSWQELKVSFNESTQMITLSMINMTGVIAKMDVTAKYNTGFFGTYTCNGEATPEFWNWDFTFNAKLNSSSNNSCAIQLVADEDSVVVNTRSNLDLNEDWYSSTCDTVINAVDAVVNLNDYVLDEIVDILPGMIVLLLTEDIVQMLIPTEKIIGSDETMGIEDHVGICYHNTTIIADTLFLGMSITFDDDTFGDIVQSDGLAFSASEMEIDDSNLSEIAVVVVFGFIGSLFGCVCNYALLRYLGKTESLFGGKSKVQDDLVEYNKDDVGNGKEGGNADDAGNGIEGDNADDVGNRTEGDNPTTTR